MRSPDFVKVNFDAAYYSETGKGAWDCVARSEHGDFLAAKAGTLDHLTGPLHAEAMAGMMATEAAAALGIHMVIFESDSQVPVHALNSDEYDRALIGVLLRETWNICYANFESFKFSFCYRKCNNVAHELAAYGFRAGAADLSWIEHAPDVVSGLIASDAAVQVQ